MKRRSFVFLFSSGLGTTAAIRKFVDSDDDIRYWRREIPNSFFLVTDDCDVDQLAAKFIEAFGPAPFLLMEYRDEGSEGLLSDRSWHLLNHKKKPPTKPR